MIRPLVAGIDSLYWSARVESAEFGPLLRARQEAESPGGESIPWACVDGFTLSALPHGKPGYPAAFDCDEFRVYVTDSRSRPTVWVQVRSGWLQEAGAESAHRQSVDAVGALLGAKIRLAHASRVDLFADLAGWTLVHDDRRGIVSHGKIRTFSTAGSDELQTLQVGKSPLLVRMYRKDVEVAQKGGHAPLFSQGWRGPVTRVEVQVSSKKLRDFQLADCAEVFAMTGDIWRYATQQYVQLREPGAGEREKWRLRDEWKLVQEVGLAEFPASGLVPFTLVKGRRDKVVSSLLGYLASYASFDGIESPREVLDRLLREFPELVAARSGRSFASEMLRRRALLPRAVRRLREGLLPAGKESDARRSDLNNRITTDEVGGHS